MRSKILILSIFAVGCSGIPCERGGSCGPAQPSEVKVVQENAVPGTVTGEWVEPMYDTVKVPGQLDPTATYYRKEHQTVVEIRPEKYQDVRYGDEFK